MGNGIRETVAGKGILDFQAIEQEAFLTVAVDARAARRYMSNWLGAKTDCPGSNTPPRGPLLGTAQYRAGERGRAGRSHRVRPIAWDAVLHGRGGLDKSGAGRSPSALPLRTSDPSTRSFGFC